MALYTVAGQRWFIGPAIAFKQTNFIASEFTSISSGDWDEITGVVSVGKWGDTAKSIQVEFLDSRREISIPTTFGSTPSEFNLGRNPTDPGQAAILAASQNSSVFYAMRMYFNDAPLSGTPTTAYFIARWSPASFDGGNAQSHDTWTPQLLISSNIVIVPRSA